eukprot:327019-Chlamydomonas_euryale.AAC.1
MEVAGASCRNPCPLGLLWWRGWRAPQSTWPAEDTRVRARPRGPTICARTHPNAPNLLKFPPYGREAAAGGATLRGGDGGRPQLQVQLKLQPRDGPPPLSHRDVFQPRARADFPFEAARQPRYQAPCRYRAVARSRGGQTGTGSGERGGERVCAPGNAAPGLFFPIDRFTYQRSRSTRR